MSAEGKLVELGITLPAPPAAMATYAPAVKAGHLLYIAGQGPTRDGAVTIRGKVGVTVSLAEAAEAARLSTLNALAVAKASLGSLDKVKRVVYCRVFVACGADFTDQPKVGNGATELIKQIWGEDRLPARAAVGVNVLPLDIPVEVELVLEV